LWKEIQLTSSDVQDHLVALEKTFPDADIIAYGLEMINSANAHKEKTAAAALAKDNGEATNPIKSIEPPIKEIHKSVDILEILKCESYSPSLVGPERARHDCRMEMINIVNEVC
jgi:hypothetical protein